MIVGALGAEFRRFEERVYEGQNARAVIAECVYPTDIADLWDAVTNEERIPRWFSPVTGDLKLGGRYKIKGNAEGVITRCDPPRAFDLTWEFGGGTSWVNVRLAQEAEGTRFTLEHIAPIGIMAEHWDSYGPAAVGAGWDLALVGLRTYLASGESIDHEQFEQWSTTAEGMAFVRASTAAWAQAHIAAGADPEIAQGMAERTAKFYTGEA